MKKIVKVKVSDNPNNNFDTILYLYDDEDKEVLNMSIEKLAGEAIQMEMNSQKKLKPSIWDICGNFIMESNPEHYIIEKLINKEYYGYFKSESEDLYMRPSDGIIIAFNKEIPIYLSDSLYKSEEVKESQDDLDSKIKKALEKEDYEEAARLKNLKNK